MWKRRDKKIVGREEPEARHLVDIWKQATKYYNQDSHWTHKRSASPEQAQPKHQKDEARAVKGYAMKIEEKTSTVAGR